MKEELKVLLKHQEILFKAIHEGKDINEVAKANNIKLSKPI